MDDDEPTQPSARTYPIYDASDPDVQVAHTTDPIAAAHWNEAIWH
ncbi:hypothetical protein [Williamsia sp. D3]|nr:hypothetical protein [Williamsia sp. D3]